MASRIRLIAVLALAAACLLVAPAARAMADCAGAEAEAADQSTAALEESVLCLINERRAGAGLAPVRLNVKLGQAAAGHSNDMVQNGFFSHTSPSRGSFIDRISATGYMKGARSWLVGENLVWGSGDLSTPASMVEAWLESPPHRANLLRDRYREIGLSGVRGTPYEAGDAAGITVSSEYGYREVKKKSKKARRAARKAKLRKRR
jgi:uncharacterized protein YkwD